MNRPAIVASLAKVDESSPGVQERKTRRFTLDFDHFVDGHVNVEEVPELLHTFDQNVYRLFVWCLTKDGVEFLKPIKR